MNDSSSLDSPGVDDCDDTAMQQVMRMCKFVALTA